MQQVNLLSKLTREKVFFPASQMVLSFGALIAVLFLISMGLFVYDYNQSQQYHQLLTKKDKAQQSFQKTAKKYPMLVKDEALALTVSHIKKRHMELMKVYNLVTQLPLMQGFSDYLSALSGAVPKGLAINNIFVSQEARNIVLKGVATEPLIVSTLVNNLYQYPLFKPFVFKMYSILDKNGQVQFKVATESFKEDNGEKNKTS